MPEPHPDDPAELRERIGRMAITLARYRDQGLRCFSTSSFQSNSVVLLHLLSRLAPEVPVWFLNTGFHFPETLAFRRGLARQWGLDVRDALSPIPRIQQRDPQGRLLYASDPDYCCHINKVMPLDPVLAQNDVWINGVRGSQSATRAAMQVEERGRNGILRYHPLLDWTGRDVGTYIHAHGLPGHPLEAEGYWSVGCAPCTANPNGGGLDDRGGRWAGLKKTECGLHLSPGEQT